MSIVDTGRTSGRSQIGKCPTQAKPSSVGIGVDDRLQPLELINVPRTGSGWLEDCSVQEKKNLRGQ